MTPQEVAAWFDSEQTGYHDLSDGSSQHVYGYHALNWVHSLSALGDREFSHCVAFGCAKGDDVEPIAHRVERFTCLEPAKAWWREEIGGTPATYMAPDMTGRIALADANADLVTCFSALHHVPTASYVISEFSRILAKDGVLIIREPIHTLGDWRRPRRGLTPYERGFPVDWLREALLAHGFAIERIRFCQFPLSSRIGPMFLKPYFNSYLLTYFDWACSALTAWNLHYHRDSLLKKMAPATAAVVARRI